MKKTAISAALATLIPAFASAADTDKNAETVKFYGKANATFQSSNEGNGSFSDVKSNASRVGVKGTLPIGNGIKGIYKMEYQVSIDGEEDTFSQRNIYAGFEGGFGQVIGGKFDTPLKVAQKKVDLFNDLEGDIKSIITKSDNRNANSLQYSSPSFGGFKATAAFISNKKEDVVNGGARNNGTSLSFAYDNDGLYAAYAFDQDVEKQNWDVQRWVGQYSFSQVTLGGLYEIQEKEDGSEQKGWVVSGAYKLNDWTMKAQYGQSDVVKTGAETYSLGLDYKLSSAAKVFAFWTDETAQGNYERNYAGVGTEFKF